MIHRQLKIALRTLWKNRLFTTLHVVGLAIGLSAAWVVFQFSSFEKIHYSRIADRNRIFRVVSNFKTTNGQNEGNGGCPEPLHRAAEMVAGVQKALPVQDLWVTGVFPEGAKKANPENDNVVKTQSSYFEILPYRWLAGSRISALKEPNQVVLTRKKAEAYFPRLTPDEILGRKIDYQFFEDSASATVVGVVDDLDFPSSFVAQDFISLQKKDDGVWSNTNSSDQLFLLLEKNADPKTVEKTINDLSDKNSKADLEKWKMTRSLSLQPLAEVHFDSNYESHIRTANPKVLTALGWIAAFLLLLASINYVNLSTAQIPMRSREIGVRKTLGSSRRSIIFSFLTETFLISAMAVLVSIFLTKWAFHFFEKDLPAEVLKFADWRATGLFLVGLVALVTAVAGFYPSWLASRFQAVSLLKGSFSGQNQSKSNRGGLRKSLIVFQFFVAQAFIIGAIFVGRQLDFMLKTDLGFDREAVAVVRVPFVTALKPAFKNKEKMFAESIRKLPEIESAAIGDALFEGRYSSNSQTRINEKGEKISFNLFRKRGYAGLLEFYKVPLLAGRTPAAGRENSEFVINETALKMYGFETPEAAIGQQLFEGNEAKNGRQIVGVAKDFFTGSLVETVKPTAIWGFEEGSVPMTINFRLASRRPEDWPVAMKKAEAEWQKIYPDDAFQPRFYDETLREIYAADLSMSRFVGAATGVAIFLACLGLFGLATFSAVRRAKEISVRKVLGASAASVVGLLSREFLILVAVGFALAAPLSVFFLKKFLSFYAYRVDLDWRWIAAAGAVGAVLAFLTVSFQAVKAALADPVKSLRSE